MKILNLDKWGERATEILDVCSDVSYLLYCRSKKDFLVDCRDFDGIISNLNFGIDKEIVEGLPHLKFIASCTTGLDHIDLDYCKAKGIKVISLQGDPMLQDVYATAEHTWALILSLIRKVPWAFDDVKQGNWEREKWQGTELRGKTLGIIGYGRVGQQVARIAEAFGMRWLAVDNYPWNQEKFFSEADIITVHVPLTEETKGMFGIEQFKLMKKSAYFINTSRGAVVDEVALLEALNGRWIAGAALDVLAEEPKAPAGLWAYVTKGNGLIITPHIGGNTAESREKTQIHIANKIKEYIDEM